MMKRFISIILAVLILVLAGCSANPTDTENSVSKDDYDALVSENNELKKNLDEATADLNAAQEEIASLKEQLEEALSIKETPPALYEAAAAIEKLLENDNGLIYNASCSGTTLTITCTSKDVDGSVERFKSNPQEYADSWNSVLSGSCGDLMYDFVVSTLHIYKLSEDDITVVLSLVSYNDNKVVYASSTNGEMTLDCVNDQ